MFDQHFHSTLSDGRKDNKQIIKEAKEKWLSFVSCTDHDFINSDFTKLAQEAWIMSVEWVEISWVDDSINKHLHLTCYSKKFKWRVINILDESRWNKQNKVRLQIELLASNWFIANRGDFYSFTRWTGSIWDFNAWHIATYIFSNNYNVQFANSIAWEELTTWKFIRRFLKREWDFAYIWSVELPEYEPNIKLVWDLAWENWAILAIAHPNFKLTIDQFKTRIVWYLNAWINAVEINSKASGEWIRLILDYRQKYNYLLTFWSDCHFRRSDSKHWDFWEINPLIDNELLKKAFIDFKQKLGV